MDNIKAYKMIINTHIEDIIINKGVKFLQPGDLLICNGHAEFYVGDGYIFELVGIDEKISEKNLEKVMVKKIKVVWGCDKSEEIRSFFIKKLIFYIMIEYKSRCFAS